MSNRFNPNALMSAAEDLDAAMGGVPAPPPSPDALDTFEDLDDFELDDAGFRLLVAAQRSPNEAMPVASPNPVMMQVDPGSAILSASNPEAFVQGVRDALAAYVDPVVVAPLVPYDDDSSPEALDVDDDEVIAPPNSVEPDNVVSSSSGFSPSAFLVS
jgi:hypothetical protein